MHITVPLNQQSYKPTTVLSIRMPTVTSLIHANLVLQFLQVTQLVTIILLGIISCSLL